MEINTVSNKNSERWSFTGFLSIWILLSLIGESIMYFLVDLLYPFSTPGYSYLQLFILRTLFLSAFPIGMIGLVTLFLPFQKIDFSGPAIIKSLEHKLLFLCTTPILYVGYLIANKLALADSLIKPGFGFIYFGLVIWITIFIWIFFSLWCWELLLGKNKSVTLRILRTDRKNNQIDTVTNISQISIQSNSDKRHQSLFRKTSLRYISFMCGLPILFIMLAVILDPNGGFVAGFLISIGLNVLVCFFSLHMFKNYLNQQGNNFDILNQLNDLLFGEEDIEPYFLIIGIFSLYIIFFISSIIDYFIPNVFILIFLLLVLIFVSMLWSNQIKGFFHCR